MQADGQMVCRHHERTPVGSHAGPPPTATALLVCPATLQRRYFWPAGGGQARRAARHGRGRQAAQHRRPARPLRAHARGRRAGPECPWPATFVGRWYRMMRHARLMLESAAGPVEARAARQVGVSVDQRQLLWLALVRVTPQPKDLGHLPDVQEPGPSRQESSSSRQREAAQHPRACGGRPREAAPHPRTRPLAAGATGGAPEAPSPTRLPCPAGPGRAGERNSGAACGCPCPPSGMSRPIRSQRLSLRRQS